MDGDEVINSGTVIIEGNRIKAVGAKKDIEIPRNAVKYDISGQTVMPGIIDVHAHGPYGSNGIIPQQNWASFAALAFGITTNHDPSSHTANGGIVEVGDKLANRFVIVNAGGIRKDDDLTCRSEHGSIQRRRLALPP